MPTRTPFQIALATLWLTCMPAEAHSIDIGWIRLSSRVQLDAPETPVSASSGSLVFAETEDTEPRPHKTLLSADQQLLYLNIYRDADYRERAYKFGPLPLYERSELQHCMRDGRRFDADNWAGEFSPSTGLLLLGYSVSCADYRHWQDDRFILLDTRTPGTPLLAIGRPANAEQISLAPLQPMPEGHGEQWLKLLNGDSGARHYSLPSAPTYFTLVQSTHSEDGEQALRELRRLHSNAFAHKGDSDTLEPLRDFLTKHDYRQLGVGVRDVPRLLNDIAFWLDAAGNPEAARPLLEEVLQREPDRIAAYLNLADIDWQLYQLQPDLGLYEARAQERYRIYCGLRLTRQLSVPQRVLERLQLSEASEQACRPHWPLLNAVRADDLPLVERLLDQGVSGHVVGDDGKSALVLALHKPNLKIAQRLLAGGARLTGLYPYRTQLAQALMLDLKEDPALAHPTRFRFLAAAGAPFEEPELNDQTLLLQYAGNPRDLRILEELLRHRQNVDHRNKDGNNALQRALSAGNFRAADMLLDAGANLNQLFDGRLHCKNINTAYSPIQLLANAVQSERSHDDDTRRVSYASFAKMLKAGADLTLGQRCGLRGEDVLLEFLIRARRGDLIALLDSTDTPRQPINYQVTEAAIRNLRETRAMQDDSAWETMLAVLQRGAPINPKIDMQQHAQPELSAALQYQLSADRYFELLRQGADPWAADEHGQTVVPALIEARKEDHLRALEAVLNQYPDHATACAKPLLEIADKLNQSDQNPSTATHAIVASLLSSPKCNPLDNVGELQHTAIVEHLLRGVEKLNDAAVLAALKQRLATFPPRGT